MTSKVLLMEAYPSVALGKVEKQETGEDRCSVERLVIVWIGSQYGASPTTKNTRKNKSKKGSLMVRTPPLKTQEKNKSKRAV